MLIFEEAVVRLGCGAACGMSLPQAQSDFHIKMSPATTAAAPVIVL